MGSASKMADYTYWQNALQGNFGPVHDDDPQPGFYRKRTGKAAGYVGVAIWEHDGKMVCVCGAGTMDPNEVWTYCCPHPITEEQYRDWRAGGKWWDEDDSVTASLSPPPAGHNQPPESETFKDQIDAALKAVATYAKIEDDVTQAKAQSARSRLLELSRDADKKREGEKAPHLEAGRVVDATWQPLVKSSKAGADAIAKVMGGYETKKARDAAEAQRKADEAARKALEDAQAKAPIGVTVEPEPTPAPAVAPAPAPIRGSYGRGASVKTVKIATVTDQSAAYAFLKDQPELIEVIQKLAQRMVTNGLTVPGVTITEEKKVV